MSKEKAALRAWLRLLATSSLIEKGLNRFLDKNFGAQLSRFDALAVLDRNRDGLTMSELSEKLLVTNGNTTSLVKHLVEEGLVTKKQAAKDRRIYTVKITAKGVRFFAKMVGPHEEALASYFSGLTKSELVDLQRLLEKTEHSVRLRSNLE